MIKFSLSRSRLRIWGVVGARRWNYLSRGGSFLKTIFGSISQMMKSKLPSPGETEAKKQNPKG